MKQKIQRSHAIYLPIVMGLALCALAALAVCAVSQPLAAAAALQPAVESKARIALLHMVDDVWFFRDLASTALRNKRRYAVRHRFELVVHTPSETSGLLAPAECGTPGASPRRRARTQGGAGGTDCFVANKSFELDKRAPTFGKIKLAIAACVGRPDYWLLWTDADALVVNQKQSLLDIVDDAFDIMVASDWFMINAGVLLLRCSPWNVAFLRRVYAAREFDHANALDQSALNSFFKESEVASHVKHVPKWLINVYTEEYVPGDFIVHFAGKLYEATPEGIAAIARQFDVLSRVDDINKISSFFTTQYLLGSFSGTCVMGNLEQDPQRECSPDDPRRLKLPEPLGSFSSPNRYRQLQYRNPSFADWKDPNDVPGRADVKQPRSLDD
jgi:hypothetical protein